MNVIRPLLDWLGWERLSQTKSRHTEILNLLKIMAENQTELAAEIRASNAAIRAATDKVIKAIAEVKAKIAALEAIIAAGGPITQDLKDAAAELSGSVTAAGTAAQEADDVVPDAPPA